MCCELCKRERTSGLASGCSRSIPFDPERSQSLLQKPACWDIHLFNDLHLTVESLGATLDQRHVGHQTHFVHMAACVEVVQRVEDEVEALEPGYVEFRILDIRVMRLNAHFRVELGGGLLRNLASCQHWA